MKNTRVFVFVDLDDSLFNSARKCPPGVELEPAALLKNGDIVSYTTPRQRALIDWLRQGATVIPVTARSTEAFKRVLLDFESMAILSFGGVILDAQCQPDTQWAQHMQTALTGAYELMYQVIRLASDWITHKQLDLRIEIVVEGTQAQYVLAKHQAARTADLTLLAEEVLKPWAVIHPGWRVFQNDNNLTLLPPGLDKAHAVSYLVKRLREEHEDVVTIGIGDSLSDAHFLSVCDYATVPNGTQLGRYLQSMVEALG